MHHGIAIVIASRLSDLSKRQGKSQGISAARSEKSLPWAICRNVLEDFCCIHFGGFSRGFSWRIFLGTFPTKMRRKNPARKSAKKSGGSKIKIREKSVLPKAGPKNPCVRKILVRNSGAGNGCANFMGA